ncbi:MAG: peptidylprolyl isomerase [Deltaproteobacteria bacterium]|nr:peptidylprolyl isomerase [Deltaproteobacteria bacterium]
MAEKNPIVTITMEHGGVIKAELYPEQAPNTVNNFISLIQKGFYDGLIFHRVIPGFVIQGGCPEGSGTGGPDYSIRGEFFRDQNDPGSILPHSRGVLSMARATDPDSAGSQFFVMVADVPHLNGQYASFGKVLEGMEVVDEIVSSDTDHMDRPEVEMRMASVTVDTHGKDYPPPETI